MYSEIKALGWSVRIRPNKQYDNLKTLQLQAGSSHKFKSMNDHLKYSDALEYLSASKVIEISFLEALKMAKASAPKAEPKKEPEKEREKEKEKELPKEEKKQESSKKKSKKK